MNDTKKEMARMFQAIAVKRNLNALKEFAYGQGYRNQVTEIKNELIAEVTKAGLKGQAVIDYLAEKYTGNKMLSTTKTSAIDALCEDDE